MKAFPIKGSSVVLSDEYRKRLELQEVSNDVYLFTGANLPGEIGQKIKSHGYDPLNPVQEIIALTKEKCKKERGIAKIVTLGASYKMGPAKLQRTLSLEGTEISFEDAKAIHRGYWDTYKGVKEYEYKHLIPQYEDNSGEGSGWVLNGIGRPIGIFEDYRGDIVNRVVQSTGHDLHVRFVLIVEEVMRANAIPFKWIITDWHDQSIIEVNQQDAVRVKDLLNVECYARLNKVLGGQIPLRGDAQIVKDMAEVKVDKDSIAEYLKDLGIVEEEETE